ncbi:MAG: hypothetical protein E7265_10080 [Lachnospiraceae bacterium]|nr:hypothetical protein [Lachnospiraceae bacterium]
MDGTVEGKSGKVNLVKYEYTTHDITEYRCYNGLNQLVSSTEDHAYGINNQYTYDKSGNLTDIRRTSGTWILKQKNSYDAYGRRVMCRQPGEKIERQEYIYTQGQLSYISDNNNQLVARYIYDPAGNVLYREEKTGNQPDNAVSRYVSYTKDIRNSTRSLHPGIV